MKYNAGGSETIRLLETIFGYLGMQTVGVVHGQALSLAELKSLSRLKEQAYELGLALGS